MAFDKLDVYLASNAAFGGSGSWLKIALDTVSYDTNSIWDAANKKAVPKQAGYYLVTGRVRTTTTTVMGLAIGFNGTQTQGLGLDSAATGISAVGGSALVLCNGTTDAITLMVFPGANNTMTGGNFDTYMQILGPFGS